MRASDSLDATMGPAADPLSVGIENGVIARRDDWVEAWPEVQRSLWQQAKILLALDFDGVALSPAEGAAALPPDLNHLLQKLHASPRVVVAFLSRRSVSDLRARAVFEKAIYVGNHGSEIEGRGLARTDDLAASCRSDLVDVLSCLSRYARQLPGIVVEDNGLSLTANGAFAGDQERQRAGDLVERRPRIQLVERRGGWDVTARSSWEKRDAICQMIEHLQIPASSVIYLSGGDADERTFSQIGGAHTFVVGSAPESAAKYRLPMRMELMQFLFCLLCLVNEVSLL